MAHVHRFYIAPEVPTAAELALSREETHHALHVVRVRSGEPVELFDGQGRTLRGTVRTEGRRRAFVQVDDETRTPAPAAALTLVQAWLNHDKAVDAIIRDCTALGVTDFCFFRARHSERAPRRPERWRQIAIESCKQCGRAWLPSFTEAVDLDAALADPAGTLLVATNDLPPSPLRQSLKEGRVALLVGPEGDFTEEELATAARHGAKALSLGSATFRSEVAATVASALVLYEFDALGPRSAAASSSVSSRK
jgi:16S rRNA (uracil1498-N3)-methyltransferase